MCRKGLRNARFKCLGCFMQAFKTTSMNMCTNDPKTMLQSMCKLVVWYLAAVMLFCTMSKLDTGTSLRCGNSHWSGNAIRLLTKARDCMEVRYLVLTGAVPIASQGQKSNNWTPSSCAYPPISSKEWKAWNQMVVWLIVWCWPTCRSCRQCVETCCSPETPQALWTTPGMTCLCTHTCLHINIHLCIHKTLTCLHTHTRLHINIHLYIHKTLTCLRTHTRLHINIHLCIHKTPTCLCTHICLHINIHMCIHKTLTCLHTHTRLHINIHLCIHKTSTCLRIHTHLHINIHLCIHKTFTCPCAHTHLHINIHLSLTHLYTHTHLHINIHLYIHKTLTCLNTHTCLHINIHLCIHKILTCLHTHTRLHINIHMCIHKTFSQRWERRTSSTNTQADKNILIPECTSIAVRHPYAT